LPFSADIAIAQDPSTGTLSLRGQEILGPIRIARRDKDRGAKEATLRIEHDLSRNNDEIRAAALTIRADRPGGHPDRVTASGVIRTGDQPGAQLKGEISSLDAAWYAALFSGSVPHPKPITKQSIEEEHGDRRNQPNTLALLMNLDADLSIGSVSYRNLMIGPGHVIAKGTGEQLEATLESTGIADGRVEAIMALVRQDEQMRLSWSGKGQRLRIETIMQAVEPGQDTYLKGTGSFVSSGKGLLNDAPFGKHLSGIFNFSITNGQFGHSSILSFLAKQIHIREIEQMGFDDVQGHVRLEDEWIHADSLTVAGPLASLEGNVSVSPDHTVDGLIFVNIGPSLAKRIKIPCMSALLKTADGLTALPFAVRIKGPMEQLALSADTKVWHNAKEETRSLANTMKNLLRGCREDFSGKDAK
jgi:hypothetical protein